MSPVEIRLSQTAKSIAQTKALEVGKIEQEIDDLRSQIVVLEAKAEIGRSALERFVRFKPKVEAVYHCPWCWIMLERKQRVDMTGRKFYPSDLHGDDTLNCIYCGNDWPVPALKPAFE